MNPEFQRNVWLELTPRRLGLMVVLLALAFFAAALRRAATALRSDRSPLRQSFSIT